MYPIMTNGCHTHREDHRDAFVLAVMVIEYGQARSPVTASSTTPKSPP
jgi:hypothetical protein